MAIGTFQIGKNGITYNFFNSLKNMFKNHTIVKISVLKSARGEGKEAKESVRKYSEDIVKEFGDKYTAKIIGFTIILRKWRKSQISL